MKLEVTAIGATQARLFELLLCEQTTLMYAIKRQSKWIEDNHNNEITRAKFKQEYWNKFRHFQKYTFHFNAALRNTSTERRVIDHLIDCLRENVGTITMAHCFEQIELEAVSTILEKMLIRHQKVISMYLYNETA